MLRHRLHALLHVAVGLAAVGHWAVQVAGPVASTTKTPTGHVSLLCIIVSAGVANPPTHNHIFLCGGVGEWQYRSLGGISPLQPGYKKVEIKPRVSSSYGPSAVNCTIMTVRGSVHSNWTRHAHTGASKGQLTATTAVTAARFGTSNLVGATLLTLKVDIPVGATAAVSLPTLGIATEHIVIVGGPGFKQLFPKGGNIRPAWSTQDPAIDADHTFVTLPAISAGRYTFSVRVVAAESNAAH